MEKPFSISCRTLPLENSIEETEEDIVLYVFNHDWTAVNDLRGTVLDFFGMQHTFVYNKQEVILSEKKYRQAGAYLYPHLLKLNQLMKKMLYHIQNSTQDEALFEKLFVALKELVPSINIMLLEEPDMLDLSPVSLERFCRNPKNRQKVKLGSKQLDNFCDKLKKAIRKYFFYDQLVPIQRLTINS